MGSGITNINAKAKDASGNVISVQNPLPTDGDSLYSKDIWIAQSDIGDFSGAITDLVDNLHSIITNTTATNPKEILIHFNRTVISNAVGLGAISGNFSNTLIQICNSGGVYTTVIDDSADDTKHTSATYQLPVTAGFNAIKIQFHTADTVTLSNCVILKTLSVVARLQAAKPDNTITDINSTTGGNLKVSVEELESGISSNSNSQLNTTLFNSNGLELKIDSTTGAACNVDYAHCEIHSGDHFFLGDWVDLGNGATYDILLVVPDVTKWGHNLFIIASELEANFTLYEDTEVSDNGTALSMFDRNRNTANTPGLTFYHTPTVTSVGTILERGKMGSAKRAGGEIRGSNEIMKKQGANYLFRITNDTTSNNWINYDFDWYEHTNS